MRPWRFFAIEFLADKVPAFDLIWNALPTFVRVPVAALLATPRQRNSHHQMQLVAALGGGLIALASHGGKTALRAAVTFSPEPLSTLGLSLGEDALAIFLTWRAISHPYLAAGIAFVLMIVTVLLVTWVWRALKALFHGAEREVVQRRAFS